MINWSLVWLIPVIKLVAGVVDSGDKLVAGVVNPGYIFVAGVVDSGDKLVGHRCGFPVTI